MAALGTHPHVVQVLGAGVSVGGSHYVVMELYERGSVAHRIRTHGALPVREALDVAIKISSAMEAAHQAGILHRDIKPQNILLSDYGPALADFGISRAVVNLEWSHSLDQLTPVHAAPEILRGEHPTAAADVYSLGSTLFNMLAGSPAFFDRSEASLVAFFARVENEPLPAIAQLASFPRISHVLHTAMAKRPTDRFANATDLRIALIEAMDSMSNNGVRTLSPNQDLEKTVLRSALVESAAAGDHTIERRLVTEPLNAPSEDLLAGSEPGSGEDAHDFEDGCGVVPAHRHPHGGGWIAETAAVDVSVFVGPDAAVFGTAKVTGMATILDTAWVSDSAVVSDHARISGDADVRGAAHIEGSAEVGGDAIVADDAFVGDHAHVLGSARLFGQAIVRGSAIIKGHSFVSDREVSGDEVVDELDRPFGIVDSSRHDFEDGAGAVPARRHEYGGGWVADTATVAPTAFVGSRAKVFGRARVMDRAVVVGTSWVLGDAVVCDSARITGDAEVNGFARVSQHAEVGEHALVSDHALVSGNARIGDDAQACGNCEVTGNAIVLGTALIDGNYAVGDEQIIFGEGEAP